MTGQVAKTRWGGIADGLLRPRGFFYVAERNGAFWLVDPDGGSFLSKGVNTVRFDQDQIQSSDRVPYAEACQRKYGSQEAWRNAAAARLVRRGFNTLGSWSDEAVADKGPSPLAVTPNLDLGMSFAWEKNKQATTGTRQEFPDVFDPSFDRHIGRRANDLCGKRRGDPNILGWFIDNELRWGPDWRGADELLILFLNLSPESPGRIAAVHFLRQRYSDVARLNSTWHTSARTWDEFMALPVKPPYRRNPIYQRDAQGEAAANSADSQRAAFAADCDAFEALVAGQYFKLTCAAIKAVDSNHLILGSRFAYVPPAAIIDAAGRHTNIVSFNCYGLDANAAIAAYAVTGKPSLIGEFSFRAADSGLPNTNGAGPVVANQKERAACFTHFVTAALQHPALIGYHWFEHADQPAEGRFDGENSNFGIVTIDDRVYEDLAESMRSVNAAAEELHSGTAANT